MKACVHNPHIFVAKRKRVMEMDGGWMKRWSLQNNLQITITGQKENKTNPKLLNALMNQNCEDQGGRHSSPSQFSVNRLGVLTWKKESEDDSQLVHLNCSC